MASAHELARGHKRLRVLIEFAIAKAGTSNAHRVDTSSSPKAAGAAIYTSSTASDHRATLNARAQIRRAERQAQAQAASVKECGHG
uniref:Uncharacterized protein n=1 Tax=Pseudomonas knackmussii TaxID=65741 RepID=Q83W46_9PSED|nr:hypothetical protein [Pseudomonas knackmussii B13]